MQREVTIIGGGIVGLATAFRLIHTYGVQPTVLEAEDGIAQHQTGHNSGVMHAGLYYKPGSAKAINCRRGLQDLYDFCIEHHIPHDRCGKLVVALDIREIPALDELERRGHANGLRGIRRLTSEEISEYEPFVRGVAALHVPETGIIDYKVVARKYAELIPALGGRIVTKARVKNIRPKSDGWILDTSQGEIATPRLMNCGGLQSDRIARMCGLNPGLQIIPFRGEYYVLKPHARKLVRNLIYPVPDPRFPFLGVHFTRTVHGDIEAGPNAVLAFAREGYTRWTISPRDMIELLAFRGFWKMAFKYWKTGMGEMVRSFSRHAFYRALHRMLPALQYDDIEPYGAGVRAQAIEPSGALVDDFRFVQGDRQIHVLNAPSPAATASLSIGQTIADLAGTQFGWAK